MTEQAELCRTWSETPKTGFLATWLILSMHESLAAMINVVVDGHGKKNVVVS